jgi:hypothetical protein
MNVCALSDISTVTRLLSFVKSCNEKILNLYALSPETRLKPAEVGVFPGYPKITLQLP